MIGNVSVSCIIRLPPSFPFNSIFPSARPRSFLRPSPPFSESVTTVSGLIFNPIQILDVDDSKSLDFTEVLFRLRAADTAGPVRLSDLCSSLPLTTKSGVFLVSFAVSVASLAVRAPVLHHTLSLCSCTYT